MIEPADGWAELPSDTVRPAAARGAGQPGSSPPRVADSFTEILAGLFGDGGITIERPTAEEDERRRAFLVSDCPEASSAEQGAVDPPVHARTLVQPDGDIVTRVDPCAPGEEVGGHLQDVREWMDGYREAIRQRVLTLQLWAVGALVALPQLTSAAYGSAKEGPWYWLVAVVTTAVALGLETADKQMTNPADTPWYRWFRRVRDWKYYGHAVTGVSTAIALGGTAWAWFGDRSTTELWLLAGLLVAILVALVGVYGVARLMLERLRRRFL